MSRIEVSRTIGGGDGEKGLGGGKRIRETEAGKRRIERAKDRSSFSGTEGIFEILGRDRVHLF